MDDTLKNQTRDDIDGSEDFLFGDGPATGGAAAIGGAGDEAKVEGSTGSGLDDVKEKLLDAVEDVKDKVGDLVDKLKGDDKNPAQ